MIKVCVCSKNISADSVGTDNCPAGSVTPSS